MIRLGWAKQAQLYTDDTSSIQRSNELENDADLWDKFVQCINWLAESSKNEVRPSETQDLLSQIQTTLDQNLSSGVSKIKMNLSADVPEKHDDFEEYQFVKTIEDYFSNQITEDENKGKQIFGYTTLGYNGQS